MKHKRDGVWLVTNTALLLCSAMLVQGCDDDNEQPTVDGGAVDAPANPGVDAKREGDVLSSTDVTNDAPADAGMLPVNRPAQVPTTASRIAQLRVPAGFAVQAFASNLGNPRMMARGPDGAIYVTSTETSEVIRLIDLNGDGDAEDAGERSVVASKATNPALEAVHGIVIRDNVIYLATVKSIFRATISEGQLQNLQTLISDLPDGGQHGRRTLGIGPDNNLYISVGSTCNACPETNSENGTMLRVSLDGTTIENPPNPAHPLRTRTENISPRVFASGLRNTIGFDWQPGTNTLWGFDQGSDGLGDDLPPEEINLLTGGKAYGWPYCWGPRNVDESVDPPRTISKQAYCQTTEPPVVGYQAHAAALAFRFYRGGQLPPEYNGDAFVAFRGSWNRSFPVGYKVVRVHFNNGVPAALPGQTTPFSDFLSGLLVDNGQNQFGRLAGIEFDATGALLVAEDTNGYVYRVSAISSSANVDAGVRD